MANKPKIKKKEHMVKKKGKRERKQQQHFLKRKRRQAMGQRLDTRNPCTQYNPLSSNNNTAGQQTLTDLFTPYKYMEYFNQQKSVISDQKV